MKPPVKAALEPFGVTVFTEFTALANQHQAINLSQGFPDFDGPQLVIDAATRAMAAGSNQYAPSHGVPELRRAVADKSHRFYGLQPDADSEVTVFSGATEAIFSSIMALVEPGDEVVMIEPTYDSYAPSVAMAGGVARFVAPPSPNFRLDEQLLDAAMGPRTKLLLLNTPNNPTGRVYDRRELQAVARCAQRHDCYVLCDEVYEHLVFGQAQHLPLASLPGMWERCVTISSTAKTFSFTGWKIGYAVAPAPLTRAIRMSHQFVTFCTATPLQHAMAQAIEQSDDYYPRFQRAYDRRRALLLDHLRAVGFRVIEPQGTYFVLAEFERFGFDDDEAFCRFLTAEIGVAAIPVSAFYHQRRGGRNLVRFAFCKRRAVLEQAGERLLSLKRS